MLIIIIIIIIIILTGLREGDKREMSEEKIDCHHQDSNQGPSLVASDALTTELWCSRHPSRGRSTFSSDFVTHTSCESTQAGGTQPSLLTHTLHVQTSTRGAPSHKILTGLREGDKREMSEEKIDCHHQDSNQGPSLVASDE